MLYYCIPFFSGEKKIVKPGIQADVGKCTSACVFIIPFHTVLYSRVSIYSVPLEITRNPGAPTAFPFISLIPRVAIYTPSCRFADVVSRPPLPHGDNPFTSESWRTFPSDRLDGYFFFSFALH